MIIYGRRGSYQHLGLQICLYIILISFYRKKERFGTEQCEYVGIWSPGPATSGSAVPAYISTHMAPMLPTLMPDFYFIGDKPSDVYHQLTMLLGSSTKGTFSRSLWLRPDG